MTAKNIVIEGTRKDFSAHGGLPLLDELWNKLDLSNKLRRHMPKKKRSVGLKQIAKFKGLVYLLAMGNDCINDLEGLRCDNIFTGLLGQDFPARTASDFLSSFHKRQLEKIQNTLLELAFKIRSSISRGDPNLIISMDSTPHKQYGKKMEGVAMNYKGILGYDSQNAYDQFGLSYLFDLRPGNTWSGKEAERWIYQIFSKAPSKLNKYFRADSAYSSLSILKALKVHQVKFTVVLKENIGRYVRKKNELIWSRTDLEFFGSKDCEVSTGSYPLKQLGNLRVVFLRKRVKQRPEGKQLNLFTSGNRYEDEYKYYSIVTNIPENIMSNEEVIKFYRGRANCENFIKEQKYGYDMLHFPCLKFTANKVWGLIATIAHNLIRAIGLMLKNSGQSKNCYFSKKIRNTFINIPCQVVRSARKIKLKINLVAKEMLMGLLITLKNTFT